MRGRRAVSLSISIALGVLSGCTAPGTGGDGDNVKPLSTPVPSVADPSSAPTYSLTLGDIAGWEGMADWEVILDPLPANAPRGLTEAEAIAVAATILPGIGGTDEVLFAGHGMGKAELLKEPEPIWIIVVAADPRPRAGGPACVGGASCAPAMLVRDYAGVVVSDRTGQVVRMFTKGHLVTPNP